MDGELEKLSQNKYTSKCNACATLHLPRKQKCHCGGRVIPILKSSNSPQTFFNHELPKYFHIGELLDYNPVDASLIEPIMSNPNSKENMKKILDHLKAMLIDGSNGQEWVFVGADGPPLCFNAANYRRRTWQIRLGRSCVGERSSQHEPTQNVL